jgi:hypothetical protein
VIHDSQKLNQKEQSMTKVTKIALEEHRKVSAVTEGSARRRLSAQWYKDAEGVLAMRWVIEVEPDERRLPATLAASKEMEWPEVPVFCRCGLVEPSSGRRATTGIGRFRLKSRC